MIDRIFQRLGQNPHSLFTESELQGWDAEAFDDFARLGLLKRTDLDYSRATVFRGGRLLRIVSGPQDALIEAIDDEDIESTPVSVTVDEILQWEFDVASWAHDFNSRHEIVGVPARQNDRLWWLGQYAGADTFLPLTPAGDIGVGMSLPKGSVLPIVILPPHSQVSNEPSARGDRRLVWLGAGGYALKPTLLEVVMSAPSEGFIEPVPGFRRSVDFRSANWNGEVFPLTPQQSQVVEILLDAYLNGTPDVGQAYLLDRIGTTAQDLRHTFRDSTAWMRLVVPGATKGTFRVAL